MKLTFLDLITAGVSFFAVWAAYIYFRPPHGDTTPLNEAWRLRQGYDRKGYNPHGETL